MSISKIIKNISSLLSKVIALIMSFIMVVTLSSCSRYVSSYKALGLVKTQSLHNIDVSFLLLKGELVFKIKKTDSNLEGDIKYSLQVDEGEIRIYYDMYDFKEELVFAKAGESIDSRGGYIEGGKMIYIIIEAKEESRGKIKIELNDE